MGTPSAQSKAQKLVSHYSASGVYDVVSEDNLSSSSPEGSEHRNATKRRLFSLCNNNELHGPTMSSALKVTKIVITLTSLEKLWLDTVRQLGDNETSPHSTTSLGDIAR